MFTIVHLAQDVSRESRYISTTLVQTLERTLEKGEKSLLYLNKRGNYSSLVCKDCQYLFECKHCDRALTVHKNPKKCICHICAEQTPYPISCPHCHGSQLLELGVGTEHIEEVIGKIFPTAKVYRFDSDALKTVASKSEALAHLERADIIIGTKMLTTGFNFEKIGCIGIILAESEFALPSYNTEERAYENLRQIIGRGNRKSQKTEIILQTYIPKNPLIKDLTESNFKVFFKRCLKERKEFNYPPFSEIIKLEYRNESKEKSLKFMQELGKKLEKYNTEDRYSIFVWSHAPKKYNKYYSQILIQGKNIRSLLQHIEKEIIQDGNLQVLFHEK